MIIEEVKIKVSYDGENHSSGTMSSISFTNKDFKKALREMFHCKENESIVGIDIGENGISAYFETKR